ncbi:hypothetical protein ACP70R_009641 [Stipagrostis hirtigluma subsp. patula]
MNRYVPASKMFDRMRVQRMRLGHQGGINGKPFNSESDHF